jgi:ABC-2 type transport system permease protein
MTATLVTSGVSNILGNIPQLEWMHAWLFTYYWLDFADLMRVPIEWGSLASNLVLQLGWIAVFGALAYGRFTTKDILS